MLIWDW